MLRQSLVLLSSNISSAPSGPPRLSCIVTRTPTLFQNSTYQQLCLRSWSKEKTRNRKSRLNNPKENYLGFIPISLIASYASRVEISFVSSRNSFGAVPLSRRLPNLCRTRGCVQICSKKEVHDSKVTIIKYANSILIFLHLRYTPVVKMLSNIKITATFRFDAIECLKGKLSRWSIEKLLLCACIEK